MLGQLDEEEDKSGIARCHHLSLRSCENAQGRGLRPTIRRCFVGAGPRACPRAIKIWSRADTGVRPYHCDVGGDVLPSVRYRKPKPEAKHRVSIGERPYARCDIFTASDSVQILYNKGRQMSKLSIPGAALLLFLSVAMAPFS